MKASTTTSAANQVSPTTPTAAKQRKPREPKSEQPSVSTTTPQPQAEAAAAEQPKLLVYKRSRNGGFYVYLLGVMPEDNIGCNCRSAKKAIRYMLWKKRERVLTL